MDRRNFLKLIGFLGFAGGIPLSSAKTLFASECSEYKIFLNGTIYIDPVRKVKNLLVKDGIVNGWDIEPKDFKTAEIIDLNGSIAYPGFHDSHVHLLEAGLGFSSGCFLYGAMDSDAIVKIVKPIADKLPPDEPFFGAGFSLANYDSWSLEDLKKLDDVTQSNPAILVDQLGHNAIVNSASLKKCNITSDTNVPMGGKIIYENGKPTGMLRESAMILVGNVLFPLFKDDLIEKTSEKFFNYWASFGYTSVNDLMGGSMGRIMKPEILWNMEKKGTLPVRVNYTYTFFNLHEIDEALKYVGKDTEKVRFIGLKLFVDGAFAGGQAWTSWKNGTGDFGINYVYTDDTYGKEYNLFRIVERADELKLDVHYHVQGDKAIGSVLDALERVAAKNGKLNSAHTLIHLAFPTDEQIIRMKKFGKNLTATVQPAFWKVEENLTRYYGERINDAYPIRKLLDNNIITGFSTDFGVSPLELSSPSAIMGISLTGGGDPLLHQPLTVKEMINGFTVGSAATTPKRDVGMLDIGYKADMVVYSEDLYDISPDKFSQKNPRGVIYMDRWM